MTQKISETVHNLTQTMSSIQVYSGPWSHQDTPSILMLFMREQPQLSERICVKMVRAAWRHSSLQALHLCVEAGRLQRLCLLLTSLTKRVPGWYPPLPPPPPTHPWCASGLAWWWLILEGGKCEQVLRQMDGWALVAFSTSSQVPLHMREWRQV